MSMLDRNGISDRLRTPTKCRYSSLDDSAQNLDTLLLNLANSLKSASSAVDPPVETEPDTVDTQVGSAKPERKPTPKPEPKKRDVVINLVDLDTNKTIKSLKAGVDVKRRSLKIPPSNLPSGYFALDPEVAMDGTRSTFTCRVAHERGIDELNGILANVLKGIPETSDIELIHVNHSASPKPVGELASVTEFMDVHLANVAVPKSVVFVLKHAFDESGVDAETALAGALSMVTLTLSKPVIGTDIISMPSAETLALVWLRCACEFFKGTASLAKIMNGKFGVRVVSSETKHQDVMIGATGEVTLPIDVVSITFNVFAK